MKILLITMEYPPDKGGVGNYYYNLVKNLDNHQVEVFKASGKSFYKFFWPKWLKLYFEIKKIVKKNRPDIIWVGQILPVGTVAYLIKKKFKIPYFVSTHGMDIMLPQKSLKKEKLMKKILAEAKFITSNSQFTKNELIKLNIDDNKVEVVYPGCHISNNPKSINHNQIELIKEKLNLKDKKVLLTVGRLVERKGQDMVIKAMPRLLESFPNLIYLIIGSGPIEKNLKSISQKLKIEDNVKIIKSVSDEELPTYYQLADVFVMSSRDIDGDVEGFGMVYLEAISFGLPVVAGNSGGVPEVVIDNQTGLLVVPDNVLDLSQKIFELFSDQKKGNQLASNGQKMIKEKFNWEIQAEKLNNKLS